MNGFSKWILAGFLGALVAFIPFIFSMWLLYEIFPILGDEIVWLVGLVCGSFGGAYAMRKILD